jgi:NADH-quinone oxidoreductase subunit L
MGFHIATLLMLIPALPLLAALVTAVFGKWLLGERSHWPPAVAFALSCLCSLALVFAVQADLKQKEHVVTLWTWTAIPNSAVPLTPIATDSGASAGDDETPHVNIKPADSNFRVDVTLRADALTAIMLTMVTFISTLVVIYASGYMHGDPGYWRFFTYVGLFVFSMTMLVSVSNFVLLYVFWEAVGLCSYLLIGFWFEKREAAAAGMKAFLVNRVGDFGFALGVFLIWTTYGTLNFHDVKLVNTDHGVSVITDQTEIEHTEGTLVPGVLGHTRLLNSNNYAGGTLATAICLLLLVGACGKSAQFPLHVWLPDAMEGPTPVSALIHAATMVTAGVYLVARCTPLYHASTDAQHVVAVIGGFTALFAALIALTQNDLKRVLAYSTVSQLGYMFLALGTGTFAGVSSGMFHLVSHAFFKALLFLGAGSVMHAMGGVIDMRQFGGLRKKMPITCWTFLIGCLALAGVFPFAGFWSKDAVLGAVAQRAGEAGEGADLFGWLYYVGLFTAFLTAFYTFRAFFLTFWGEERIPEEAGHHAHESPPKMTYPLIILAAGAVLVGLYFRATGDFLSKDGFLARTPSLYSLSAGAVSESLAEQVQVAAVSTLVALFGIAFAWVTYVDRQRWTASLIESLRSLGLVRLSQGKFFIDEIYDALIVKPLEGLASIDAWIDRNLVDGLVNLIGAMPPFVGQSFRLLQCGLVQFYALVMVLGIVTMFWALLFVR